MRSENYQSRITVAFCGVWLMEQAQIYAAQQALRPYLRQFTYASCVPSDVKKRLAVSCGR
jgi:hypothetical protein